MDPKPELTSLPDVPSRSIVSLLPLQQVITSLPLLHSRFNLIRKSVLKSNQRLVLYIGDLKEIKAKKCRSQLGVPFSSHLVDSNGCPLYPDTSFSRLHLLTLNQHSVEQLSTLMPNLTYLEVAIAHVDLSVMPHLITLLTFWGPTLQTLKLIIQEFKSSNEEHWQRTYLPTVASNLRLLIRSINSQLLALENLSLDLDDSLVDRYQKRLNRKINNAALDVLRFHNWNILHPIGDPFPAIDIDDAVRRLNLLIKEVANFLNQEPPPEANNAEEVLAQKRNLSQQLGRNDRFTSDILFKGDSEAILNLSILGQLKEFSFDTGRQSPSMQAFILQALAKYGSNQLTCISIAREGIWSLENGSWNLPALANSPFASQFTQFPLTYEPGRRHDTPSLSGFTNLKVYTLDWLDLAPNQMARLCELSSLPNLQCLELCGFNKDTPLLKAGFASLPSFSSVTVLKISIYNVSQNPDQIHACLEAPYWAHLFPSVQIIQLLPRGRHCMSCFPNASKKRHWKIESYEPVLETCETVLPCVKRLLAPLRELPSLRKIFYQQNETTSGENNAITEFTPEGELLQTNEFVY